MTLPQSIISTLAYSDHFSYPLTFDELYSRLVSVRTTRDELKHELSRLISQQIIGSDHGFYYLPGRAKLINDRSANLTSSRPKLSLAQKYAGILSHIPGVVAIYLTGSLAVNNAKSYDDLDFMIITSSGRLWLTRLILTIYCQLLGIKRSSSEHLRKDSNHVCLNLYLTESSLTLPLSRRSLYTAYELIQAVPLFDPSNTHSRLLSDNSWLYSYLPNQTMLRVIAPAKPSPSSLFELIAFKLQYWYMRQKITREYVTLDQAFFHPHNPARQVLQKICSTQLIRSKKSRISSTKKAKK